MHIAKKCGLGLTRSKGNVIFINVQKGFFCGGAREANLQNLLRHKISKKCILNTKIGLGFAKDFDSHTCFKCA